MVRLICNITSSQLTRTTVTLLLSDEDFGKLILGKARAQQLFMSGKLKIRGDLMKGEFTIVDTTN